jgi:hypothetical protein
MGDRDSPTVGGQSPLSGWGEWFFRTVKLDKAVLVPARGGAEAFLECWVVPAGAGPAPRPDAL